METSPTVYDAFTLKFLETEGTSRGFRSGEEEGEEDLRRSESEFVGSFDSLLRNNRDQVPPQYFYERLTHILMRSREAIMPANRRDSMGGDATAAGIAGGSACSAYDDDRLVRATMDIFRRVHAQHPVSAVAVAGANTPTPTAYLRTSALTWTPLDSDKRAKGRQDKDENPTKLNGVNSRGVGADWHRFSALVKAAGGDLESLEQLCGGGGARGGVKVLARGAAGRRGGGSIDAENGKRSSVQSQGSRGVGGSSGGSGSGRKIPGYKSAPPLGAALLFLHAADVFASDAACRLAVFNARTASDAAAAPSSQGPSSQSPAAPGSSQPPDSSGGGSAWAVGLLQEALLFRFVSDHPTSETDRASFLRDLLDLAGAAAERVATEQIVAAAMFAKTKADTHADVDAHTPPPPPPTLPSPPPAGAEDVSPDEIAGAAHRLLSRLSDLLDAMESVVGANGRRLTAVRTQMNDAMTRYWRFEPRLWEVEAKRAFLGAMPGTPTHKLRLARSVLQNTMENKRLAPRLMHPGLGSRTNPAFAVDVFTYVHNDADRAIKSQKDSMGSADYHESVGRLGLLIGASAQAAAALAPPFSLAETATGSSAAVDVGGAAVGVVPYSESLRVAVDAFTAAAVGAGNMAMAPSIAASMDAALGSCARCSTLDPKP
jgi:hypothetical protein